MQKNFEIYTNKFVTLLFYFIPLALLTGPFLPDLFLSIISIYFIIVALRNKLKKYFFNNFFYIFILFYFYLILSSLTSDFILFSLKSSFVYFRFGIFAIATWYLIDQNKNFIRNFFIVFIITFLFVIVDGYIQLIYTENIFGFSSFDPIRLNLTFSDRMLLGNYLARILPLLLALIVFTMPSNYKSYLLIGFLLISTDILVYMTGERTALGLIFTMTIFVILFMSKFRILRLITFILSIVIISIITFSNEQIKERNIDLTINQLGLDDNDPKINYFTPIHESHFKSALKIFYENPFTGSGPNNFRKLCGNKDFNIDRFSCSTHPHNTYIQLISETGVIGMIFLLIIVSYFLKIVAIHSKSLIFREKSFINDYQVCLIACFLLTLFPFLPTLNFFNNWINVIYYLPVGFYLHSIYKDKLEY